MYNAVQDSYKGDGCVLCGTIILILLYCCKDNMDKVTTAAAVD